MTRCEILELIASGYTTLYVKWTNHPTWAKLSNVRYRNDIVTYDACWLDGSSLSKNNTMLIEEFAERAAVIQGAI